MTFDEKFEHSMTVMLLLERIVCDSSQSAFYFSGNELIFSNTECVLLLALLFNLFRSARFESCSTFLFFFCGDGTRGGCSFDDNATGSAGALLLLFRNPSNRCEMGIATDFTTFGNLRHCSIQFRYETKSEDALEHTFKCDRKSSRSRITSLACFGYLRNPRFFFRKTEDLWT